MIVYTILASGARRTPGTKGTAVGSAVEKGLGRVVVGRKGVVNQPGPHQGLRHQLAAEVLGEVLLVASEDVTGRLEQLQLVVLVMLDVLVLRKLHGGARVLDHAGSPRMLLQTRVKGHRSNLDALRVPALGQHGHQVVELGTILRHWGLAQTVRKARPPRRGRVEEVDPRLSLAQWLLQADNDTRVAVEGVRDSLHHCRLESRRGPQDHVPRPGSTNVLVDVHRPLGKGLLPSHAHTPLVLFLTVPTRHE